MTALDLALRYASVGLRCIPVPHHTKHPTIGAWQHAASTDRNKLERWLNGTDTGIGLVLGQLHDFADTPTYVFAADIDMHGVDGEDAWRDVVAGRELPDTAEQITGGGGRHLLFTSPVEIRNSAGTNLPDGIDIRGAGGFIVAEPTIHPSGVEYCWTEGAEPWQGIAAAPQWLIDLLTAVPEQVERPAVTVAPSGRPGDDWAASTTWADLLSRDGWTWSHSDRSGVDYWCRPGKEVRDGHSATVGYGGSDSLKVFTSDAHPLVAERAYSKFGYLAATRFDGDHQAAARWCREQGHGTSGDGLDGFTDIVPTATTNPAAGGGGDAPWPDLVPLEQPKQLPPWPVHILPAWMSDHITTTSEQLQTPIDLCAQFALGAAASVAMGHTRVAVNEWCEPLNLYLATALPSGGGKSPAEKAMTAPVRQWEEKRREDSIKEVSESMSRKTVLDNTAKAAEKAASIGSIPLAQAIEARIEADTFVVKHPFRRLADDATPEKLTQLIAEQNGLMAILSTEAALMDMAAGAYSGKNGPNINIYLKAFSGDPLQVDRKGSATTGPTELRIKEPLLTVGLAMQPSVIDFVGTNNAQLEGRGFFARFLYSRPTPTTGHRDRRKILNPIDRSHATRYAAKMLACAEQWATPVEPMTLTTDAEIRFCDHLNIQEPKLLDEYLPISDWMAKLQASMVRITGLLHLLHGHHHTQPIGVDTVNDAITLGEYFIEHALSMAASNEDNATIDDAKAILAHVERKAITHAKPRDFYLAMRARFRSVDDTAAPLMHLEACGYLRLVAGAWENVGSHGGAVAVEFRPPVARVARSRGDENAFGASNPAPVARVARGSLSGMSEKVHSSTQSEPITTNEPTRDSRDWPDHAEADESAQPVDNSPESTPDHTGHVPGTIIPELAALLG